MSTVSGKATAACYPRDGDYLRTLAGGSSASLGKIPLTRFRVVQRESRRKIKEKLRFAGRKQLVPPRYSYGIRAVSSIRDYPYFRRGITNQL